MKNFKFLGLFLVLSFITFYACEQEHAIPSLSDAIVIGIDDQRFNTTKQQDLEDLVHFKVKETIKKIESVQIITTNDEQGDFFVVTSKYLNDKNQVVNLAIPLKESITKANNVSYSVDCTMSCTAERFCTGCDQTIHQRCKRQTCKCSGGSGLGGCKSTMGF